MRFLTPAALWLLPLIGVLFFLSRRRPALERHTVANLFLWSAAPVGHGLASRRFRWRVLLQAAFMLAVIGALLQPVVPWRNPGMAVVIDLSASMGAREAAGTRLDEARRRAIETIASWPSGTPVRIIGARGAPVDIAAVTSGTTDVSRALESLPPGAGAASFEAALQLARTAAPGAPLWIFSDAAAPAGFESERGHWVRVGRPLENLAITSIMAAPVPGQPADRDVLIEVVNYGAQAHDAGVELASQDRILWRETLHLAPRGSRSVLHRYTGLDGVLEARLISVNDGLATDNRRLALVAPLSRIRVGLLAANQPFIERALAAHPAISPRPPQSAVDGPLADDVLVIAGDTVPPGSTPVLLLGSAGGAAGQTQLSISSPGHPILQGLDVAHASVMPAGDPLSIENGDAIVRAGGRPAIIVSESGGRRVVGFNFDVNASALAMGSAFPLLVARAVEWLAAKDAPPGDVAADANVPASESDLVAPAEVPALPVGDPDRPPPDLRLAPFLLAVALALFATDWWLFPARARSRWRRGVVAVLLAISVIGLPLPLGFSGQTVVFVLDRSDSVPLRVQRAALARVDAMLSSMHPDDRAGVVVFGADAAVERPLAAPSGLGNIAATVSTAGTNIEAAIRVARSLVPEGGNARLVLLTDGRETSGRADREAAFAAASGVALDSVPLGAGPVRAPAVRRVAAPGEAQLGEPFLVTVDVAGIPGSHVQVAFLAGSDAPEVRGVDIGPDGEGSTAFQHVRSDAGVYFFRARLESEDAGGSTAGTAITVAGVPRILLLTAAGAGSTVAAPLAAAGFQVDVSDPAHRPAASFSPGAYDAVVLDDVPAEAFPAGWLDSLARYVEDGGGGLLLLGSPRSLDALGYPETALGRLLPIDLARRGGRRAPPMAFVIVFDKSGSMSDQVRGVQKIQLARESVMKLLEVLPGADAVGVLAFDSNPVVIAPVAEQRDARAIATRLRSIEPEGSTIMAPAVSQAVEWLRRYPAGRRHLLLVSDGRTSPGDASRVGAIVRNASVEVSSIAIGPDADRAWLHGLAAETGGRAYAPTDATLLPALVAREAVRSAGGALVEERSLVHAGREHPILEGIDLVSVPALGGYVGSAAKPGADAILISHLDDPVLAGWRAGLGHVAVFTGGLGSSWSAGLRRWPGFARLWTQTARWLARRTPGVPLRADVMETTDGLHLTIEADGPNGVIELDNARAIVRSPGGRDGEVGLRAVAPGRYAADIAAPAEGEYHIAILGTDAATGAQLRVNRGFYRSGDRERSTDGVNLSLLNGLASQTGGRILGDGMNPLTATRRLAYRDVGAWLSLAALFLFLADVAAGSGAATRRGASSFAGWPGSRRGFRQPSPGSRS